MLNVALIDWNIGDSPLAFTAEILHFKSEQVPVVTVCFKDDRPIDFALVPGPTGAPTGNEAVYDYPKPDTNTIRISIPHEWTECVLTFLHGNNATVVACHHEVMPPDVLYEDYRSNIAIRAGYLTILLADAEEEEVDEVIAAE